MTLAYLNDLYSQNKSALILGTYLSMQGIQINRKVAGDLAFNDDGTINQSDEWLFNWEKNDPICYARKAQKANLNLKDYLLTL